jgi:uncharacterized membrane protein
MTRIRRRLEPGAVAGLVLCLAFILATATPARSADRSFALRSLTTTAYVAADGSMSVTEKITYEFDGGPFNFGIRSFRPDQRRRITDFSATAENGEPLTVIPPSTSLSGEWEWGLRGVSNRRVTYTLRYKVPDAIDLGTDVGELYWQFLGEDHPGVDDVTIEVVAPEAFPPATETTSDADASVLRAWGHGPRNGRVDVLAGRVRLTVSDVPGGVFVEARVAIPATGFDGPPESGPRLATIIAEEGEAIDETFDGPRRFDPVVGNVLASVMVLAGAGALGAVWARYGREPKPDPMIGDYWREPLDDPPAIVLANLSKGKVALGRTVGSTLIDLAQRGYLTITEEHEERWGSDKTVHRLRWAGKPTDDLAPFERSLLQHVFLGRTETTIDDVTAWATANQTQARAFARAFERDVGAAFSARQYKAKVQPKATIWLVAAAVAVALGSFVSARLGGNLSVVGYVAAVALFAAGSILVVNRTQRGADEKAKAQALKAYLKDFSNLEEAPVGHLVLWDRFLVYAVALGVADELLDGLRVRLPNLADDPHLGAWYRGPGIGAGRLGHLAPFAGSFGNATATAIAPPSRSGSGGGFSGGGGGGGGGGGFGAR